MDFLLVYLFKAMLISGILYGYYLLALRNKQFHAYNRFYLLLSVLASLLLPFVSLNWLLIKTPADSSLHVFIQQASVSDRPDIESRFGMRDITLVACALVSLSLFVLLATKVTWIYLLKSRNKSSKMDGFVLVETEVKEAPFSFLNNLFWKRTLDVSEENSSKIFNHELAHIRQGHTYDKLFTQLVCCACWVNPFYWLIHKELDTIHEFIADEAAIEHGDTAAFAAMLLQTYNDGSYLSPSHSFFNSSIKRRLIMISSSNNTRYSYLRRILVLPISFLVVLLLSVTLEAQTTEETAIATLPAIADTVPNRKQLQKPVTVRGFQLAKKQVPATVTVPGKKRQKPVVVQGYKFSERQGQSLQKAIASQATQEKAMAQQVEAVRAQLTTLNAVQQNLESVTAANLAKPATAEKLNAVQQNVQALNLATEQLNAQVVELAKMTATQSLQEVKPSGKKLKAPRMTLSEKYAPASQGVEEVEVINRKLEGRKKKRKE